MRGLGYVTYRVVTVKTLRPAQTRLCGAGVFRSAKIPEPPCRPPASIELLSLPPAGRRSSLRDPASVIHRVTMVCWLTRQTRRQDSGELSSDSEEFSSVAGLDHARNKLSRPCPAVIRFIAEHDKFGMSCFHSGCQKAIHPRSNVHRLIMLT